MAKIDPAEWLKLDKKIDAAIDPLNRSVDSLRTSVESLQPRGWRRLAHILRAEVAPLGTVIAILLSLLVGMMSAVYIAFGHAKEDARFQTKTEDRLDRIEVQMGSLRALIAASQPNERRNQLAAKELLSEARRRVIPPIPTEVVELAGGKFIAASKSEPAAWAVALDFVAYRSELNSSFGPSGTVPVPVDGRWRYNVNCPPGKLRPDVQFSRNSGSLPPNRGARLDKIDIDQNSDKAEVPALLLVTGGVMALDGQHIRNVVFRGVEVHYSGHPTIIENATFINCTFVIDNDPPGRRLGETMLAASPVNFRSFV